MYTLWACHSYIYEIPLAASISVSATFAIRQVLTLYRLYHICLFITLAGSFIVVAILEATERKFEESSIRNFYCLVSSALC